MSFNPKAFQPAEEGDFSSRSLQIIQTYKARVKNPLTAIRANCMECSGGSRSQVAECKIVRCALHPFRMGTNPYHAKTQARLARDEGSDDDDAGSDAEPGATE